ncbi:molecular chaperone-like protein [Methylobacterium durans]|uniref:Molecular chaperone-like protein n=1 Tax=Methylobacterium durans TaxID=2202825 RepID=A0A2U8WEE0_9HYPH|nr:molecular chaperone-like protein [Methylobacterium durans]AWN43642.1 molecular chaperone-like protein [Methylobacterium durans]MEA1832639.1 molecular chaperone-like protein [Methylobacterium durans]
MPRWLLILAVATLGLALVGSVLLTLRGMPADDPGRKPAVEIPCGPAVPPGTGAPPPACPQNVPPK